MISEFKEEVRTTCVVKVECNEDWFHLYYNKNWTSHKIRNILEKVLESTEEYKGEERLIKIYNLLRYDGFNSLCEYAIESEFVVDISEED